MRYAITCVIVLAVCILLGYAATKLVALLRNRLSPTPDRKVFSKAANAAITAVFAFAFLAIGVLGFVNTVNRADDSARQSLESDSAVSVERTVNGYLFDGPGTKSALVFYPGALVEPTAYAPLLHSLAEAGIDTFVVEPPLNIAFLSTNAATDLMDSYTYASWYVGGHSLGGVAAASFASKHAVDGLVLLASYPTQEVTVPLLSIYGTEDHVLNLQAYEEARPLWTAVAQELVIDGGNHAYFGNYGEQSGDGTALITHDQQQRATVEAITAFIEDSAKPT